MIRLVCIDVDGTLVGKSGEPSPETWSAAGKARAQGIRLAICSGRPGFGRAREYASRLDSTGWHIFQNGSSVVHLPDGETRSRPLAEDAVLALIGRSRETGRILELYTDHEYFVESSAPRARQHARLLGVPYTCIDLDRRSGTIVRAQWIVAHDEADRVLAEPHPGLTVAASLSPIMPDATFINVTPDGVDKGDALRRVAEAYGFALEDVMMVGDSDNDLPALRAAGVPVAMGNAEPSVRHVATRVVADVDRGGLVQALELAMSR